MTASAASGTQAATLTTEHTLYTASAAGTYVLAVDADALDNSDVLILRVKTKVGSAGTTRLAYYAAFAHAQEEKVKISIPISSAHECVFTLQQQEGTARSFPWEVIQLDA